MLPVGSLARELGSDVAMACVPGVLDEYVEADPLERRRILPEAPFPVGEVVHSGGRE